MKDKKDKREIPPREGFVSLMRRLGSKKDDDFEREEINLDKNDMKAMMLSSFLTLFLPAIAILVVLAVGVLALFGVFS